MSVPSHKLNTSRIRGGVAAIYTFAGVTLLASGRRDFPDLHTMLDTGMVLTSGMLAWFLWDLGGRMGRSLPGLLAVSFGVTAFAELVHALVTIEWTGVLAPIAQLETVLRPSTWAPAAHVLPIGIACSVLLIGHHQAARRLSLLLIVLSGVFFVTFYSIPRYTSPLWLGITRPTLIVVPLLWVGVAAICWQRRAMDRLLPIVAFMALVMVMANIAMLYSRAPHDTQAMVAHLGRVAGYLTVLLSLMQMGSTDMGARLDAERKLAVLNEELEHRVEERTAQLELVNQSLEAQMVVRKGAEHALRASQALLQAISDNSSAVIYAKDLDGRYLMVNRRFTELFHLDADAIVGKTDYHLFTKEAADVFRAVDQRVVAAGMALTEEEPVPLDDGLHKFVSVKCPLWDDTGKPYAVFGISTDITDRTRAEDALRASEERTRLIVETALDAAVAIDAAGLITGWSPQAEKTFGWKHDEAVGRVLAETIIPLRYRESHRRGLERFLATGEGMVLNTRVELSALHRDGTEFPVELSITPIRMGGTVSFSAFVRDITNRKRMEAALMEGQRYYQALAESLPHLLWTSGPEGYFDFLSEQWVAYTGRPAQEQLGYGWMERVHGDDRQRVQAAWAQAVVRGDTLDVEFRIRGADGAYRWFQARAVPLRGATGEIVKWFGSNTDVEDYKRSEQRLRAQLERLDLLDRLTRAIGQRQDLQSILQVVIRSLEDHLTIDFCCVCMYDRTDESLVVTRVGVKSQALAMDLAMPEHARIAIDQNGLSRCVRGQLVHEPDIRQASSPFPQRLARAGLRSFVAAPLLVESNVFGVLLVARRDSPSFSSAECEFLRQLSEHVALAAHQAQLHAALQHAYDDLRQTQHAVMQQERLKALGQMASGIAHDINNAISPVALYTESLLENEPGLSARARDYLSIIQRAIEDVAQTVSRMREFYRQREPQLVLTPVNVNHLMQEVIDLTRARWSDMPQQRGVVIDLATAFEPDPPAIMGVQSEIREALINLIFNAVDAMPDGGTLTLRTHTSDTPPSSPEHLPARRMELEVVDTGAGMDADTRRRCLEPFFTTKGERGTGLGLAMVYGMVQRHSADIEIESAPGRGTTVRLMFAVPSVVTEDAPSARVQAPSRPSRLRILIVDDDPLLLKSLQDALEGDGHVVTAANGGQAGIDAFRTAHQLSAQFAVVITDLGMPYVDGRQVARTIKETAPETPVILLTGWGQRLVDEGDVPSHVDAVLNKPPKLAELRTALAELTVRGGRP